MFYDNLKAECDKKGLKVSTIVSECGGAIGSIGGWKKGAMPNSSIVVALSMRLNVTTDYLLIGKESINLLSNDEQNLISIYKKLSPINQNRIMERAETLSELEVPVADETTVKSEVEEQRLKINCSTYQVSAGTGFELGEGDEWYEIEVPDTPEARKADFALQIKGNSMEPIYFDGDIVLVKKQSSVDLGQIGIFNIEDNGYIKKFGGDRLVSLNAEYDDIEFSDYDEERIRCCGKVIGRA